MSDPTTHVFRVALARKRSVYRDIEVISDQSLYDLAEGIIDAFDFELDHAFGFYSGLTRRTMMRAHPQYELFADTGEGSVARSVKRTSVRQAFRRIGHKLMFLFDYGDEWLFRVEVIGFGDEAAGARYPKIVASKGKAPPQYAEFEE